MGSVRALLWLKRSGQPAATDLGKPGAPERSPTVGCRHSDKDTFDMNSALERVKGVWNHTQACGIALVITLVFIVGSSVVISRSGTEGPASHNHLDRNGNRRVLRVCYSPDRGRRQELNRNDLLAIARTYNMLKNERPVFDELLRLNEGCKVSPTAEALKCSQSPCQPGPSSICPTCLLLVPLRD